MCNADRSVAFGRVGSGRSRSVAFVRCDRVGRVRSGLVGRSVQSVRRSVGGWVGLSVSRSVCWSEPLGGWVGRWVVLPSELFDNITACV